jgi:hypothetical protein
MTRSRDVADTQDNLGGAVAPFVAGKNRLINADFGVNQRNFTSTQASSAYTFDRWQTEGAGGVGTLTWSAQTFTPGTAPVAGYESTNFFRMASTSQSVASDYMLIDQRIEDARTFANQTVTLSFWAKAATGTPKVGTTLIQSFGSGGSAFVITKSGDVTITTSWARYSVTILVPSVAGKTIGAGSYVRTLLWASGGTALNAYTNIGVQNNTIDIWGVQLEAGNVATPFTPAGGGFPGAELALCQRYYQKFLGVGSGQVISGFGGCVTSTIAQASIVFPVQMRVSATSFDGYLPAWYNYGNNTTYSSGTFTMTDVTPSIVKIRYTHGSAIFTAGQVGEFVSAGGNGYLAFSAEL